MANMMGVVVIPFVARPAISAIFGMDDEAFARFIDERRAELPKLILNSLRQ
jgi:hypothetical protein